MQAQPPARHLLAVGLALSAEALDQRRLLIPVDERDKGGEEHRRVDQQHRPAEQRCRREWLSRRSPSPRSAQRGPLSGRGRRVSPEAA